MSAVDSSPSLYRRLYCVKVTSLYWSAGLTNNLAHETFTGCILAIAEVIVLNFKPFAQAAVAMSLLFTKAVAVTYPHCSFQPDCPVVKYTINSIFDDGSEVTGFFSIANGFEVAEVDLDYSGGVKFPPTIYDAFKWTVISNQSANSYYDANGVRHNYSSLITLVNSAIPWSTPQPTLTFAWSPAWPNYKGNFDEMPLVPVTTVIGGCLLDSGCPYVPYFATSTTVTASSIAPVSVPAMGPLIAAMLACLSFAKVVVAPRLSRRREAI